jgi:hypothetical protein
LVAVDYSSDSFYCHVLSFIAGASASGDGKAVTMATLQAYLTKHRALVEEMEELVDFEHGVLMSSNSFETFNQAGFCGWDFTKYTVHKMFDNGSCEFFAGLVDLGQLDTCPIYMFDLSDSKDPPRFVGNFHTYMTRVFTAYLEGGEGKN